MLSPSSQHGRTTHQRVIFSYLSHPKTQKAFFGTMRVYFTRVVRFFGSFHLKNPFADIILFSFFFHSVKAAKKQRSPSPGKCKKKVGANIESSLLETIGVTTLYKKMRKKYPFVFVKLEFCLLLPTLSTFFLV